MGEWKNYFVYTRKERLAIISLLLITLVLLAIPHLFEPPLVPVKLTMSLPLVEIKDSVASDAEERTFNRVERPNNRIPGDRPARLFLFDPNSASEKDLMALGLTEKAANVLVHFREKGGRFRKPEDLGKIYSIRKDLLNRLIPYVKIEKPEIEKRPAFESRKSLSEDYASKTSGLEPVDINAADQSGFESLPCIGTTLALRIIRFREKLGGFAHIGQVKEVFGISDSVFQVIGPRLFCVAGTCKQIDLNQAGEPELSQHPYFRGRLGNAILRYREQHGAFQSKEDLRKLGGVDENTWKRIEPYVLIKSG